MKKLLIPTKDTSIYQAFESRSCGLDEILDIGKVINVDETVPLYESGSARTLLYFDLPTTESVSATANYYLNLRLANASNLKRNQQLVVYQVSRSWDEGSGFFNQSTRNVNDGATWLQCTTTTSWSRAGGDFLTGSTYVTSSLTTYPLEDLRIDITNILRPIVSQSLQSSFYGLGIQFPIADEIDDENLGNIKVFSAQTHTIHQPTLEISWDNQVFNTGSLSSIPSTNVKISPSNLLESYTKGDVVRISLTVRDEFPLRSFDSTLRYKNKYYLPTSSYYSITDAQSNTIVFPFDNGTKINTDANGSYVILDTSPLYKGRFYTLKFKIETGSYSRVINTNTLFKIN